MPAHGLDTSLDRLFEAPLSDFVRLRGQEARRLKAEGAREDAAIVAKLPRPSVVAWAANRLVLGDPDAFEALVDATRAVIGARGDLGTALRIQRDRLTAAVDVAEAALQQAGHRTSHDVVDRLRVTVFALALHVARGDDEPVPGRLVRELAPPEVEETLVGTAKGRHVAPPARRTPARRKDADAARTREAVREAERRRASLERERRVLEGEREHADHARRAACRERDARQAEAERLAAEADALDRQAGELRRRARDAATAAVHAGEQELAAERRLDLLGGKLADLDDALARVARPGAREAGSRERP